MGRITEQEFDLIHSAVTEWKYKHEKTMEKFHREYGIDETKWDSYTVNLFNDYLKEAKDIMKATNVVWETLFDLKNEMDE